MKTENKKNALARNTIWSFMGKVIAMLFLIVLDILAARLLSVNGYAEWVYYFAILTMMFYVGWFGINTSAKVYVSKCERNLDRNNCIRAAFSLRLIGSIVLGVMIFIIMPRFAGNLGYPDKYAHLKTLLELAAILVFFNSFTELFKELFIGLQTYKNLFMITVCEYGGYLLFTVLFLWIVKDVQAITYGYALSGLCVLILGLYLLRCKVGYRHKETDVRYKEYIKPIFKYAIPIAIISFGGLILVEMDTFMLGLLSNKVEVATYSIAKNLCSKATHVNYALTVGTMTSFSVLTLENIKEKRKKFHKINKINIIITVGISLAMLIFGTVAITLFYGNEYRNAGTVMCYLIPYYMLYSVSNFYSSFLDFRGKAKFRSICYISVIIINLILNCLLIPMYGAKGAAIATNASLVPYTILVTVATFKEFHKGTEKEEMKYDKDI